MKSFIYSFMLFMIVYALSSISANAGSLFVYRNLKNESTLSFETVKKIFDASKLTWEEGKTILFIIKDIEQVDEREMIEFSGLSKMQFLNKWRIKFFSGRSMMPVQVKDDEAALKLLKENPYGIYFSFSDLGPTKEETNIKLEKYEF